MKPIRKLTTLILVVSLILSSVSVMATDYKQKFWDVPKSHWAFEYIADLTTRGVITGYSDGSFKPEATVTRAEWAKLMCVAANLSTYDTNTYFSDTEGHWANTYINAAKDYITTYNNKTFRPDQAIVREDVTRSLVVLRGYDITDVDYSHIAHFKDFDSISNYMKAYVAVGVEKGLITGFEDNTFRGQSTLTRAEAATLLYRAFQKGDASKYTEVPEIPYEKPNIPDVSKKEEDDKKVDNKTEHLQENKSPTTHVTTPSSEPSKPSESKEHEKEQSEKKSQQIEKVTSIDIESADQISSNGKDTIYYMQDNKIFSRNMITDKLICMANLNELEVNTDAAYKTGFKVYSICYDSFTDGILLFGYYQTVNSSVDRASEYLYSITEDGIEILSTDIPAGINYIQGVLTTGDILSDDTIWDRDTLDAKGNYTSYIEGGFGLALWGYAYDVVESDDTLRFVGIYVADEGTAWEQCQVMVSEYDYATTSNIWELSGNAFGICEDYVVSFDGSAFNVYNYHGKLLQSIKSNAGTSKMLRRIIALEDCFMYYSGDNNCLYKVYLSK